MKPEDTSSTKVQYSLLAKSLALKYILYFLNQPKHGLRDLMLDLYPFFKQQRAQSKILKPEIDRIFSLLCHNSRSVPELSNKIKSELKAEYYDLISIDVYGDLESLFTKETMKLFKRYDYEHLKQTFRYIEAYCNVGLAQNATKMVRSY